MFMTMTYGQGYSKGAIFYVNIFLKELKVVSRKKVWI